MEGAVNVGDARLRKNRASFGSWRCWLNFGMILLLQFINGILRSRLELHLTGVINNSEPGVSISVLASVNTDLVEVGIQEVLTLGTSSAFVIDEQVKDDLAGNNVSVAWNVGVSQMTVFGAPEIGVSVTGDSVIGAALVGAEGSNETAGSQVLAVVTGGEEETVVPGEGREGLVPVLNCLNSFEDGRGAGQSLQFSEEAARVSTDLVVELEDLGDNLTIEATNHWDLSSSGESLGPGVLSELSRSICVGNECIGRVDDRSHHGAGGVGAGSNTGVVPPGVE